MGVSEGTRRSQDSGAFQVVFKEFLETSRKTQGRFRKSQGGWGSQRHHRGMSRVYLEVPGELQGAKEGSRGS